ncbi:pyruvate kinase [Alkalilimnicola ehrlichii MLHE-1]|uniref:Pyruvate kinase n=1 Tax=Alkalilimnicola ehrlichii (strain ATCC BAA-1101 / DSM 17681 / MLHE-1) TaxID=187272 RepID=Q0A4Q4_ALKEH|nr:pyruvate kinase [Alkalilimnicola ehrlichii]ABI58183.1 pyruvate kinase [Alkalilimnicola ehrlichii MLHE-1]
MPLPRRTKIIATLGPASDGPQMATRLVKAGIDLVRINFSHGTVDDHRRRVEAVRQAAREAGREVGVLADLQGPKIRIEGFRNGAVDLEEDAPFTLDTALDKDAGDTERVGVAYPQLVRDVEPGDVLLLDDGRVLLKVESVSDTAIHCRVATGGRLSNRKGLNRLGGGLSAEALTDKDEADIRTAVELGADYLAVSFVREAADVERARELLQAAGGNAGIIAKIERAEALDCQTEIIQAADAIMVARGDLGVEIGDAALPQVQKQLIHQARDLNRVVITATQMMESMIESPLPTRAEVFDVANAVLDGTDAVMLSAETAAGEYPDAAVAAMDRVCREAEKSRAATESGHRLECRFGSSEEAVAMAAMYTANHLPVKAIIALTESGTTALWMSRIRSGIPIYALTRHPETQGRVTLYRGVYPIAFDPTQGDADSVRQRLVQTLREKRLVTEEDHLVLTFGSRMGVAGGTNTMKVVKVGDLLNGTGH